MSALCSLLVACAFTRFSADYARDQQALLQSSWQVSQVNQQHLASGTDKNNVCLCGHSGEPICSAENCRFQNPKVWGPPTWFFLHSVALAQEEQIPEEQQKRLARFLSEDLSWLLPCPESGKNFRRHLANTTVISIETALKTGRQGLIHWLVTMHNIVNRDLQKQEMSFDDAFKYFTKVFASNHAPCFGEGWTVTGIIKNLLGTEKSCVTSGCFRTSAVWGPPAWFFLHSMALALPKKIPTEQQGHIDRFLGTDLSWILPCPSCGENLRRRLPLMPSIKDVLHQGRDALVQWLVALHNSVNKDLNKTQVSIDKATQLFTKFFSNEVAPCMRQPTSSLAQMDHSISLS